MNEAECGKSAERRNDKIVVEKRRQAELHTLSHSLFPPTPLVHRKKKIRLRRGCIFHQKESVCKTLERERERERTDVSSASVDAAAGVPKRHHPKKREKKQNKHTQKFAQWSRNQACGKYITSFIIRRARLALSLVLPILVITILAYFFSFNKFAKKPRYSEMVIINKGIYIDPFFYITFIKKVTKNTSKLYKMHL